MNVFTPTTWPFTFTSGPPLFPGLIGGSVWTYTSGESGSNCRAVALTTPMVTELRSPSGLPNANTSSPCCNSRYGASANLGKCSASTFNNAKSRSRATPTTRAGTTVPLAAKALRAEVSAVAEGRTTWMLSAPFTTCAFVMMYPLASITNPLPIALCLPITTPVFPCSVSSTAPKPVTSICTTLGDTLLMSACTDSFTFRSSFVAGSCPSVALAQHNHTKIAKTAQLDLGLLFAIVLLLTTRSSMKHPSFPQPFGSPPCLECQSHPGTTCAVPLLQILQRRILVFGTRTGC